jgi:hypothetical protein
VGFGMEILFVCARAFDTGPEAAAHNAGHVAQRKVELENATLGLKSQPAAETRICTGVSGACGRRPMRN